MKKKIQDMDLKSKTVIVRCDFNVPIENGKIMDDSKIKSSLETIEYLQDNNCRIIILSHLGKVKTEEDKTKYTLEPVAKRLKELVQGNVIFSKQARSLNLELKVKELMPGDILLLENTRHEDIPNKLESKCDMQLASYWAELADVFINDAFASSHRIHASTAGIAKFIPSGIGFLIQREMDALNKYIFNPEHPFTMIMGGSKVEDKMPIIESLLPKCDNLLLGGGIANGFLKTLGFNIGFNLELKDINILNNLKNLMLNNKEKISLPLDVIVGSSFDENRAEYRLIDKIEENDLVYDIGSLTIDKYKKIINESKTIFVNGTLGVYEDSRFANGTREILDILSKSSANVIVGGGDAVSATNRFGYADKMTYLCSGGGATLEYLATGHLAALDEIDDDEDGKEKKEYDYEVLDI